MQDDKRLDNNELNEVAGGGIFGNQSEQRFKVGDIVYGPPFRTKDIMPVRGKVVECLGLEGIFYGTYEYMVSFDDGICRKVSQSYLKKPEDYH